MSSLDIIRKRRHEEDFKQYDEYLSQIEQQLKRARTELLESKRSALTDHVLSINPHIFTNIIPFLSTSSLLSILKTNQSHQHSIEVLSRRPELHKESTDLICDEGKLITINNPHYTDIIKSMKRYTQSYSFHYPKSSPLEQIERSINRIWMFRYNNDVYSVSHINSRQIDKYTPFDPNIHLLHKMNHLERLICVEHLDVDTVKPPSSIWYLHASDIIYKENIGWADAYKRLKYLSLFWTREHDMTFIDEMPYLAVLQLDSIKWKDSQNEAGIDNMANSNPLNRHNLVKGVDIIIFTGKTLFKPNIPTRIVSALQLHDQYNWWHILNDNYYPGKHIIELCGNDYYVLYNGFNQFIQANTKCSTVTRLILSVEETVPVTPLEQERVIELFNRIHTSKLFTSLKQLTICFIVYFIDVPLVFRENSPVILPNTYWTVDGCKYSLIQINMPFENRKHIEGRINWKNYIPIYETLHYKDIFNIEQEVDLSVQRSVELEQQS